MGEYRYELATVGSRVGRRGLRGSTAGHGRQMQVLQRAIVLVAGARATRSEIEEVGSPLDVNPTTTDVRIICWFFVLDH